MSNRIYESVTATIVAALERGVVPWRKPWHTGVQLPANVKTNRPYRGVNAFLLSLAPHTDHRWLTLKQATELGGHIREGEKSSMVVFWKFWNPPQEGEQQAEKQRSVPVLRYYLVWNAEQCEGLDLAPLVPVRLTTPNERIARADDLVSLMKNPPEVREAGCAAWYSPSKDLVQVPPLTTFESADHFYATLFHELGHATGHPDRLARAGVCGDVYFGSGEYSKEELVAELTSAFCCATVGLDPTLMEDSASYLQGWLKVFRGDPKAVVIAAAQAQRAADFIMGITYQ